MLSLPVFLLTQVEAAICRLGEENGMQGHEVVWGERQVEKTEEGVMLYVGIKVAKSRKGIGEVRIGEDGNECEESGEGANGDGEVNETGDGGKGGHKFNASKSKVNGNTLSGSMGESNGLRGAAGAKYALKGGTGSRGSRTPKVARSNTPGNREETGENGDNGGEGTKRQRGSRTPKKGLPGEKRTSRPKSEMTRSSSDKVGGRAPGSSSTSAIDSLGKEGVVGVGVEGEVGVHGVRRYRAKKTQKGVGSGGGGQMMTPSGYTPWWQTSNKGQDKVGQLLHLHTDTLLKVVWMVGEMDRSFNAKVSQRSKYFVP